MAVNSARVAERACRLAPRLSCAALRQAAADMASEQRSLALDPGLAPHLAARMLNKPGLKITTTLDRNVQTLAGEALRRQMMALGRDQQGRYVGTGIPRNEPAEVIAYKVVDGQAMLCRQPVERDGRMTLTFKPARITDVRKALEDAGNM